MLLTIYYMAATLLQSFRLRSFIARVARSLNENISVVFYTCPDGATDVPVSSELCLNQREANIEDVLWDRGHYRGYTVHPRQVISINPWITFPRTPLNIPIQIMGARASHEMPTKSLYMLVEAKFNDSRERSDSSGAEPSSREQITRFPRHTDNLFVEEFGVPLAWRVDSHFSFLLRTDNERLLQFVWASFMADNYLINNDLQLLRIQSVDVQGVAQPFESIQQHTKTMFEIEPRTLNHPPQREKYMGLLNDLCFLARQADEFNAERTRQGQPDLIASSCRGSPRKEEIASLKPLVEGSLNIQEEAGKKKKILRRTKRSEGSFISDGKPPNILVYSESSVSRDNAVVALQTVLKPDTYTVYALTPGDVTSRIWQDNTRLLVVCGALTQGIAPLLLEFYLKHCGNLLCLCSDLLNVILPNYRTAEVREQELAQFSYNRWQKVHLMHHIFCYQPSPIKKHFSHDSEDNGIHGPKPKILCPKSVEVIDSGGVKHPVDVEILGVEETWRTPSILLATNRVNKGRAIFSQVHLEADPSQFEGDEGRYDALKNSNSQRLEILSDLLCTYLNVEVRKDFSGPELEYTAGYLLADELGRKERFLKEIQAKLDASGCLSSSAMNLTWTHGNQKIIPKATERFLPISVDHDPVGFDRQKYFQALTTTSIGRLAIYVPIVSSSMDVVDKLSLAHGLVVIPKYQTNGSGRGKNKWLSAEGCIMFTIQLRIPLCSVVGQRIPLIQHIMATAAVNAVLREEGYQDLDLRIKWPNDIYAYGTIKVGGLIVTTTIEGGDAVCNVGVGLNLDNGSPTSCINDLIRDFNNTNNQHLKTFGPETMFAKIFNELERLLNEIEETGSLNGFYNLYYQLWLHQDQEVQVQDQKGVIKSGIVSGIDEYGYLKVAVGECGPELSVHPDGNRFDMLRGLIFPKFN